MFCKHCGFELPENSNFCPKCGKVNDTNNQEPLNDNKNEVPEINMFSDFSIYEENKKQLSGKILKNAIMGLAFALSFYLSPIGLVFSIISRSLLRKYKSSYPSTDAKAGVGNGIGIAGLVLSIIFTVLLAIYVLAFFVTLLGLSELSSIDMYDVYDPFGF